MASPQIDPTQQRMHFLIHFGRHPVQGRIG
jgi:hypothetical protein